ncbi:MAG: orotidine-5'-phosphate decarboxylase [Caulobacteraceae bacterium]
MTFADRFLALATSRSPLCVGLDPSRALLRQWELSENAEGVRRLVGTVLEAAADKVAVFKPQSAFFEAFGAPGMAELARATAAIRARGALSLIDAKRGDVGSTTEGYADAMVGAASGFGADAMTAAAYLGFAPLSPLLDRARETGGAVFVVVRSSNPEGAALQDARLPDGRTVAEALADEITAYNAAVGGTLGPACAVIGATLEAAVARPTLARLERSLILAPGVGVQGASFADLARTFGRAAARTLPAVSRAILQEGPRVGRLREAIDRCREQAWTLGAGTTAEAAAGA